MRQRPADTAERNWLRWQVPEDTPVEKKQLVEQMKKDANERRLKAKKIESERRAARSKRQRDDF